VGACHDPSALSERRGRRGAAVHRLHNENSVAPRESAGPANIGDADYCAACRGAARNDEPLIFIPPYQPKTGAICNRFPIQLMQEYRSLESALPHPAETPCRFLGPAVHSRRHLDPVNGFPTRAER